MKPSDYRKAVPHQHGKPVFRKKSTKDVMRAKLKEDARKRIKDHTFLE